MNSKSTLGQQKAQFTRRVAASPEVNLTRLPFVVTDFRDFVRHSVQGVKSRVYVVFHREISVKCRQCKLTTWPQAFTHSPHHGFIVALSGHQTESALTQTDHRVESPKVFGCAKRSSVEPFKGRPHHGIFLSNFNEVLTDINSMNHEPPPSEFVSVTSGTTPHVKNPLPGLEIKMLHQEVDFLNSPLGE